MKKIILPLAVVVSGTIYAQVGVNNTDPQATLDITAKTTNGSKPEGLIAPRLTGDQIRLANAQYASAQTGTIVYATAADTAPAGKTANITAAGYYYFDGSVWQKLITGTTGDTTNDAWVNSPGNSRVELGSLSDGTTARPAGTEFVARDNGNVGIGTSTPGVRLSVLAAGDMNGINLNNSTSAVGTRTRFGIGAGNPNWSALYYTNVSSTVGRFGIGDYVTANEYLSIPTSGSNQGNVGIGITTPDSSAILDVSATNKGFLPPRLALVSTDNASPLSAHVTGMVVYNTATAGTSPNNVTPGLYINDGNSWKQFVTSVQKSSSYFGNVNYGDIGSGSGSKPVTGFIVSAIKTTGLPTANGGMSVDDLLVTHNLNLSSNQNITVTILSNSTGNNYTQYNNDNDWFQPVIHDITPNSFKVYIEENYGTVQNVTMMIQLSNY